MQGQFRGMEPPTQIHQSDSPTDFVEWVGEPDSSIISHLLNQHLWLHARVFHKNNFFNKKNGGTHHASALGLV